MLDRIRRKLFLSLKVMSSTTTPVSDNAHAEQNVGLKRNEIMSILRKGSSAISGVERGLTLRAFLSSPVHTILQASRSHDDARATKMKRDVGDEIGLEDEKLLDDAEEEEKKLLQGVAQVQSRLFEGKVVDKASSTKSHKEAAEEWRDLQKRQRKNRIVIIDGFEVLAEHLGPEVVSSAADFERDDTALNVISSRPRSLLRRRGPSNGRTGACIVATAVNLYFVNPVQEVYDHPSSLHGPVYVRPTVVHASCHGLSKTAVKRMNFFTCPHHHCGGCGRGTGDAGGMLFR